MPARKVRLLPSDPELRSGLEQIRTELELPDAFAGAVLGVASSSAAHEQDLGPRVDLREVPFVTIDPAGSRDLDQAYCASRRTGGTRVRYAIADVAAFVTAGDAVDLAAHARGVTVYLPDRRAPLYPEVLGEGAASLLPGVDRPAVCWTIDLDDAGAATEWRLERAVVRSRRQMTYAEAQQELAAGRAAEPLVLLREIGLLREAQERARGGTSLPLPSQEVRLHRGAYELAYDVPLAVEGWNAQISLLAGICAAHTMLDGGVGILRTLPPPDPRAIERLRGVARGTRDPLGRERLLRRPRARAAPRRPGGRGVRGAGSRDAPRRRLHARRSGGDDTTRARRARRVRTLTSPRRSAASPTGTRTRSWSRCVPGGRRLPKRTTHCRASPTSCATPPDVLPRRSARSSTSPRPSCSADGSARRSRRR